MRHLGPPPRKPRPKLQTLLAADYARRAGIAACYREAAGITDPHQVTARLKRCLRGWCNGVTSSARPPRCDLVAWRLNV